MIEMSLFAKEKWTHGHRKQTYGYQRENKRLMGKLEVWEYQRHTTICAVLSGFRCV